MVSASVSVYWFLSGVPGLLPFNDGLLYGNTCKKVRPFPPQVAVFIVFYHSNRGRKSGTGTRRWVCCDYPQVGLGRTVEGVWNAVLEEPVSAQSCAVGGKAREASTLSHGGLTLSFALFSFGLALI